MALCKSMFIVLLCCLAAPAIAQPGLPEMQQVGADLGRSFFSALDAALILAAILGTFGAVRVYNNWQGGRHHITSEVTGWFYAAFFVVLMGAFLRAVFGI